MMVDNCRVHLIVQGRVQGVGFRYFVAENAAELGLSGWVRNRFDDSVELVAEGSRKSLDDLINRVKKGPRSAFVSECQVEWQDFTGEFQRFSILATS
jgi:acylphosphatase